MIAEITGLLAACPAVRSLRGGISTDYAGGSNAGLCLKSEPGLAVLAKYLNGKTLVRRDFKAELYFSFSGDAMEAVGNQRTIEQLQDEINNAPFPEISEGEIVEIRIADGGSTIKSAVGEGLLTFKFSVTYITELRRWENAQYPVC